MGEAKKAKKDENNKDIKKEEKVTGPGAAVNTEGAASSEEAVKDPGYYQSEFEKQKKQLEEYAALAADQEKKIAELESQAEEYKSSLQRRQAEFDNYKKRTAREKEALYDDIRADMLTLFLPVIDNMERAAKIMDEQADVPGIKQGMELVFKQLKDIFDTQGVEEIPSLKEEFNPDFHNAVMHIEDDSCGDNVIVDVFVKGYKLKEKVLRHSMVKVAN